MGNRESRRFKSRPTVLRFDDDQPRSRRTRKAGGTNRTRGRPGSRSTGLHPADRRSQQQLTSSYNSPFAAPKEKENSADSSTSSIEKPTKIGAASKQKFNELLEQAESRPKSTFNQSEKSLASNTPPAKKNIAPMRTMTDVSFDEEEDDETSPLAGDTGAGARSRPRKQYGPRRISVGTARSSQIVESFVPNKQRTRERSYYRRSTNPNSFRTDSYQESEIKSALSATKRLSNLRELTGIDSAHAIVPNRNGNMPSTEKADGK